MPDVESCLYTGRHREHVDTVPTDARGRPLVAWSHGRCRTCGLERRYPTRLRNASFGSRQASAAAHEQRPRHQVAVLPATQAEQAAGWTIAFDALLHTGGGKLGTAGAHRTAGRSDGSVRRPVRSHAREPRAPRRPQGPCTLVPVAWEVAPTCLAGTVEGFHFSGYWPDGIYTAVGTAVEDAGGSLAVADASEGPTSYYAMLDEPTLRALDPVVEAGVPVVGRAWEDLALVLPPLSTVLEHLPRQAVTTLSGDITWFRPRNNSWTKASDLEAPGAYRVRRFSTIDLVRTEQDVAAGTVARSTVQLSKHVAGLMLGRPLMAHDARTRTLSVPLGADLPGLYGRAVVAASGRAPTAVKSERLLVYEDVPADVAAHVHHLLST